MGVNVEVTTSVAFAPEQPTAVAYGTLMPAGGTRVVGDTDTYMLLAIAE